MGYRHSFSHTLNLISHYGAVLTTIYDLLHCLSNSNSLPSANLQVSIDENILSKNDFIIQNYFPLVLGEHSLKGVKHILTATIEYILSKKKFDVPLYQICLVLVFI